MIKTEATVSAGVEKKFKLDANVTVTAGAEERITTGTGKIVTAGVATMVTHTIVNLSESFVSLVFMAGTEVLAFVEGGADMPISLLKLLHLVAHLPHLKKEHSKGVNFPHF